MFAWNGMAESLKRDLVEKMKRGEAVDELLSYNHGLAMSLYGGRSMISYANTAEQARSLFEHGADALTPDENGVLPFRHIEAEYTRETDPERKHTLEGCLAAVAERSDIAMVAEKFPDMAERIDFTRRNAAKSAKRMTRL